MTKQTDKELKELRSKVKDLILTSDSDLDQILQDVPSELQGLFADLIIETLQEKARKDFYTFVRLMAPEIMNDGFQDGAHIKIICKALTDIESGKEKKLMIFLPPGSMKSWLASKFFVAWCLGRHPTWNILAISHSTQLAEDNVGRPTRELIESDTYKKIFPATTVKGDVKASGRWDTALGGKYFCTGAGSKIAGRRAHLTIVDDAVDEQSADSDLQREKINNWYGAGLRTRLLPEGREVCVGTRWHDEDLQGFLLKHTRSAKNIKQWKVISIPAILDKESAELLGKAEGTSFWPEFWPLDRLLELKSDPSMSTQKWNALYMQNPVPAEGNLIKLDWCQLWTHKEAAKFGRLKSESPKLEYLVMSLDTAFSEKETADYSAVSVWGVFEREQEGFKGKVFKVPSLFLLYADKGRWSFPDLCKQVADLNKDFKPDGIIIEKKASGQSLIQEMRRRGLPIIEFTPDTDKLSRVHACTPLFESGRIWFPDVGWSLDIINDLTRFPNIAKKDMVDTVSQAILWMRDTWHISSQDEEEDPDKVVPKKKTYWGALTDGR